MKAWEVMDMTNADWWARVMQARTTRDELRPQRVWALRKGEHEAAIDLKAVPGVGAEIVLTVDGEWRKTLLFRSHEQAELVGAIADTRTTFERKGCVTPGTLAVSVCTLLFAIFSFYWL